VLVHDGMLVCVVLLEVIDQNLLLLRVLVEILLESLVTDELFLEFVDFFSLHRLVV
jgi:hypothetical protein